MLAYRVWADQRRGWRFTNPNLEELGLVRAEYVSLDELAEDDAAFAMRHRNCALQTGDKSAALVKLLTILRHGLAVTADALDPATVEATANASRQSLREPWSISAQEEPRVASALIIDAPRRADAGLRGEPLMVRGGPRSRLARQLGHARIWGKRLDAKTYLEIVSALLERSRNINLSVEVPTSFDVDGWRLAANAVRLVPAEGRPDGSRQPLFCRTLQALWLTLSRAVAKHCSGSRARAYSASRSGPTRMARMAISLG